MEHDDADLESLDSHTIQQNSTFQEVVAGQNTAEDSCSALISTTAPQTSNKAPKSHHDAVSWGNIFGQSHPFSPIYRSCYATDQRDF